MDIDADRRTCAFWAVGALLVIGLIAFLLLPKVFSPRESAVRTSCASNLKQIGYACRLCADDHKGAYPSQVAMLFPGYVRDGRVYVCPTVWRAGRIEACKTPENRLILRGQICYCYVSGLRADDNPEFILAFDEEWNHKNEPGYRRDGLNVLYVTGDVRWERDFKAIHERLAKQAEELKEQGRSTRIIRPAWSRWPERPEYPVIPLRERPLVIALVAAGGIALAALTALLVIRRRRRRAPGNQT